MPDNKIELSEEQKSIVENVYGYKSKVEYTDDEVNTLKIMFDTPEKIALLRKVFQAFNAEERSFIIPHELANIQGDTFEKLGLELAIYRKADEKVRSSLVNLYLLLRDSFQEDKREEFEVKNQEDFEAAQKEEVKKEEIEDAHRVVGVNL